MMVRDHLLGLFRLAVTRVILAYARSRYLVTPL
jgi:hypothetical protein